MGVPGPGKVPFPAAMAGPYVPRWRLKYLAWVSGVPTSATSQLAGPTSCFKMRLRADHITCSHHHHT